jgi:hypothetical protein
VIFQIACVGDPGFKRSGYEKRNLPTFVEYLAEIYGGDHEVILYEAAQYPICEPTIVKVPIHEISKARVTGITTLYIPPKSRPSVDRPMAERLGIWSLPQ